MIRFHSRILHLPLTHPSRLLFQREQLMLLDDPSQFLISDIYPLFWCKVLQVSDIWQVHLPLPPDRIRVHTRSQIINEWHSDNRGKLLKSLTQLFIYSTYINLFTNNTIDTQLILKLTTKSFETASLQGVRQSSIRE